jgi:hypothetical protein
LTKALFVIKITCHENCMSQGEIGLGSEIWIFDMEPHGLSPWYLHQNTLLRPWAPKRSRLREARYGGRRKVGEQAPRLRRVIRH